MQSFFTFALLAQQVAAHSWVECSTYDPPSFDYESLGNYDRSRCSGYPRGFKTQFSAGFGVDTGYNWEYPDCSRDSYKASDYTNEVPMAQLVAGQTFYVSHPSKNHVADTCTNPYIPSNGLNVIMSSSVGVDTFDINLEMIGNEHVNGVIDHLGYQRCYNFCGNEDKAQCLTGWKLPADIAEGHHSFIWKWQFNTGQYYSSCFDAYVSASGSSSPSINTPSGSYSGSSSSSGSGSNDTITFPTYTPATTTPAPPSTDYSTDYSGSAYYSSDTSYDASASTGSSTNSQASPSSTISVFSTSIVFHRKSTS